MSGLQQAALIETAREHREAGRLSEAAAILTTVLQVTPQNPRAQHQFALTLLAGGHPDGLKLLESAVRLEPTNTERLADLGEARFGLGDAVRGIRELRAAVAFRPTKEDLALRLAKLLGRAGRVDEGELWFGRLRALRPPSGADHVMHGMMLHRAGRLGDAIGRFFRAVTEDSGYTEGFVALAGALQEVGAPLEQVMKPARVAAERLPDRPEIVIPVVQYLRDIGEEADSVRFCSALIEKQMAAVAAGPFGQHGIRILMPDELVTRIGELAHQLELHVKMKQLGWLPPFVTLLVAPKERVVNQCLLDYWREHVVVVDDPKLIELVEPLKHQVPFNPVYMRLPDGRAMSKNRVYHAVQEEWQRQGRGPLLDLKRRHVERGQETLRRLGVPDGAWYVCVHVREAGYLKEDPASPEAARNADIRAFFPAIESIVRRGGWVIRLGDSTMTPLPPMPNVVDYALSAHRSDWMDVFLAASCRFILATTSGMMVVGLNFDTPVAATNFFPPGERTSSARNLFIPKLLRRKGGDLLTFEECLRMPLALTYSARRLSDLGIEAVENDAEDIAGIAEEMLERVAGNAIYTEEDERLQARWDELGRSYEIGRTGSRIGRAFLRRHQALFAST